MDILSDLILALTQMPWSAPFILFVGLGISLLSIWATNRWTDIEKTNEVMNEIKAWREKYNKARETMDPILLEEVMAEQSKIMALNAQMMSSRCKPMCYTYIPIMAVFAILAWIYGATPVAILPFNVHKLLPFLNGYIGFPVDGGFGLLYWPWYLLSSLGLGNLLRRAAGQVMPM